MNSRHASHRSTTTACAEALEARIAPAVVYGVDTANHLVAFDSADPATFQLDVEISDLPANMKIAGIDFRPSTGELYGIGIRDDGATRSGQIFKIDQATGAATAAGPAFSATLADVGSYGFDFNPLGDTIRLSNTADVNLLIEPATGEVIFEYGALDQAGAPESIGGWAFDGNFGKINTTLYAYNYSTDELCTAAGLGSTVTPVAHATLNGSNFISGSATMGFDIGGAYGQAEVGWLSLIGGNGSHLYQMDLETAALTDLGAIGDSTRTFGSLAVSFEALDPVIVKNKATWTDIDGDVVTLTVSKGTLTGDNFRMFAGENGSVISELRLDASFSGADVKITAKPGPNGGDGRVNIGEIDATGVDLGNVTVPGDVVRINAGVVGGPASVKTLSIGSLAANGNGPVSGIGSVVSDLADGASKVKIAGDVAGILGLGTGRTGSVTVGGDIIGGTPNSFGFIGNDPDGTLGKFTLQGNLRGVADQGGSVSLYNVDSVFVRGSIIGGEGNSTGYLAVRNSPDAKIVVAGDIVGGGNNSAGSIYAVDTKSVKVGGSLIGGTGYGSGSITTAGIASITVAGDLVGGPGMQSGGIYGGTNPGDFIKTLKVGGSVVGGGADLAIYATRLGQISIGGDVTGTPTGTVTIAGLGIQTPATVADSIAIGKLSIGGDCKYAQISAGQSLFQLITPDAAIGTVKIGRDMVATSIVAGIDPVNDIYGDGDDQLIGGNAGSPNIIAKIARVTVGGQVFGTSGGAKDSFGIEGELIGLLRVGKTKVALTPAKNSFTIGGTGDVRVMEF